MNRDDSFDDSEDSRHTPAERAVAGSRSTWFSVGVNLVLTITHVVVGMRVRSSMLVANAWHARSDAASSLVAGLGIAGNLAGYPILDPIAALIVGFMVARMGWGFGWDALHDLMDRAVDEQEVDAIRKTLMDTPWGEQCA